MKPTLKFWRSRRVGSPATGDATIRDTAADWVARRDAGLSAEAQNEFEAWLAADARNRAAFAEFDSAWSVLDRPVRGGVREDVFVALQRLDRQQRRRRAVGGAATALVLIAGISFWTFSRDRMLLPSHVGQSSARVVLPSEDVLADGTKVQLRTGAGISVDFRPNLRRVVLERGEAHFQVVKDPTRPFVVAANGVEIRAVGTAFAVEIAERTVEVFVTEGQVAVDKSDAVPASANRTIAATSLVSTVNAGERVVVDAMSIETKVTPVTPVEMSERLGWRAPLLELSGTPLGEVVALLNRHATGGARFSLREPGLAAMRVSGRFRADNTTALLELLENAFGIVAERRNGGEIVLRKASMSR